MLAGVATVIGCRQYHLIIKLEIQYLGHLHNYTTARLVMVVVVSHLMVQAVDVTLHCGILSLSRNCLCSKTFVVCVDCSVLWW